MHKDPAFLFYSSDFLSGTFTMSNEQIGKYIRLLCIQHQKGVLYEKDMLNICGTYDEDIYCKFKKENNVYYNERLRFEAERRKNYAESRRNNRKKAENTIKNNNDKINTSKSYDEHMETETENINENITIDLNKEKEQKFNFKKSLIEFGFELKLIDEWLKIRKAKGAINTETALNNFIAQIQQCKQPPNEILKHIVTKSWVGFEAKWVENSFSNNNTPQSTTQASTYNVKIDNF